jgi:hypothetical protein
LVVTKIQRWEGKVMATTETGKGRSSLVEVARAATTRAFEPARQAVLASLGFYSLTGKMLVRTWKSLVAEGEHLSKNARRPAPSRRQSAGGENSQG